MLLGIQNLNHREPGFSNDNNNITNVSLNYLLCSTELHPFPIQNAENHILKQVAEQTLVLFQ